MKRSRIGAGLLKLFIVGLNIYLNDKIFLLPFKTQHMTLNVLESIWCLVSWLCMDLVRLDFLKISFFI